MKTYIIQIETHDDLTSIKDKLSWAKAQRVLFVWPRRGKVLSQYFELSLLKREAERLGVRMAFITRDPAVKENAEYLGIPIFPSVPIAEKRAWSGQTRRKIERDLPLGYEKLSEMRGEFHPAAEPTFFRNLGRYVSFLLGILAVLILLVFFLPSAQVTLYPERQKQELSFKVWADDQLKAYTVNGGIPAEVQTVELTLEKSGTSTGTVDASLETARGLVEFQSSFNQKISLPSGTLLQTKDEPQKFFILDEEITIDPTKGEATTGEVHAQAAGVDGNLAADTKLAVLSAYGDLIQARVKDDFIGGTGMVSPTPTEEDYLALEEEMLKSLRSKALDEMSGKLESNEVLIESTLEQGTINSRVRSVEPGIPADHFSLKINVTYTALSYRQSDLEALASAVLDANLPAGMSATVDSLEIVPGEGSLQMDSQEKPTWQITAKRWIFQMVDTDALSTRLAGVRTDSAGQILQTFIAVRQPGEIRLSPAWWKWMPFVPFRTQIEVN